MTSSWASSSVGVIGCGSSGIQISNAIAPRVAELHCFIRHPQFSVPLRFRPVSRAERLDTNARYDDIHAAQLLSKMALGIEDPDTKTMSVTEEERQQTFQSLWHDGNSLRFIYGGFGDLMHDAEANEEACKFFACQNQVYRQGSREAGHSDPQRIVCSPPTLRSRLVGTRSSTKTTCLLLTCKRRRSRRLRNTGFEHTSDDNIHELDIIVLATGFPKRRRKLQDRQGWHKGTWRCLPERLPDGGDQDPPRHFHSFIHFPISS